jgi:hypothetical protein
VPWLNIPYLRTAPDAPIDLHNFLVLACCAVACRHLPGGSGAVQAALQARAEHAVLLRTFDPAAHASLEGVQALLVLASWSPAVGALRADVQDGGLIATGAARMALALKLDHTAERAVVMRERAKDRGMSAEEQIIYDELMWKVRLVGVAGVLRPPDADLACSGPQCATPSGSECCFATAAQTLTPHAAA